MFEAIGHPVLKLVRIRIGGMALGDLPIGKYKILNPSEASGILKAG
jgi:23S rRNA pseudouridine2605 synthase